MDNESYYVHPSNNFALEGLMEHKITLFALQHSIKEVEVQERICEAVQNYWEEKSLGIVTAEFKTLFKGSEGLRVRSAVVLSLEQVAYWDELHPSLADCERKWAAAIMMTLIKRHPLPENAT